MDYAVDQINENIAILENTVTGEKIKINIEKLPHNIKEGNIVTIKEGFYKINVRAEANRKNRIIEKLNRLKNLQNKE